VSLIYTYIGLFPIRTTVGYAVPFYGTQLNSIQSIFITVIARLQL